YNLPEELIAQQPLEHREASRMMVVDRASGTSNDGVFTNFPDILRESDILVVNNTKVFPARLYGRTETGADVEIFLVNENSDGDWEVLAKPGRRLKEGKKILFSDDLSATVIDKREDGTVMVSFACHGDFY